MKNKKIIISVISILLVIIIFMTIAIFHLNKIIKSNKDIIKNNNETIEYQKSEISRLTMIENETYELFVNCVTSGQE